MQPVARRPPPLLRSIFLCGLAACVVPATAWSAATCEAGIEAALRRSEPLPETEGKAALMEQIQRAQIAHHEDDEGDCLDELSVATGVLDRIDAARRKHP